MRVSVALDCMKGCTQQKQEQYQQQQQINNTHHSLSPLICLDSQIALAHAPLTTTSL